MLTPLSPATAAAGPHPHGIDVDPTGQFAYVINDTGNTVSQFEVSVGGGLVPLAPAAVSVGSGGWGAIAVDPSGQYVYATNFGNRRFAI